jgi:hypothetical protein
VERKGVVLADISFEQDLVTHVSDMDFPTRGGAAVGETRLTLHLVIAFDVAVEDGAMGEGGLAEQKGACHQYPMG